MPRPLWIVVFIAVGLLLPRAADAQCSVCDPCLDDFECGPGEFCGDFSSGSYCTAWCDFTTCPGDSRCYGVPDSTGGTANICLNSDLGSNACSSAWSCSSQRTCNGLWTDCSSPDNCSQEAELCVGDATTGQWFCTCFCNTDADCGAGECVLAPNGRKVCVLQGGTTTDKCEGVVCTGGAICSPATGDCIGGSEDTQALPDVIVVPDTSADTAPADTSRPDTTFLDTAVPYDMGIRDTRVQPADTNVTVGNRIDATGESCSCTLRAQPDPRFGWEVALALFVVVGLFRFTARRRA